jgi:hypothetical protein
MNEMKHNENIIDREREREKSSNIINGKKDREILNFSLIE